MNELPQLLTEEEAARVLNVEPRTLRAWRQQFRIEAVKVGKNVVRYEPEALASFIRRHRRCQRRRPGVEIEHTPEEQEFWRRIERLIAAVVERRAVSVSVLGEKL